MAKTLFFPLKSYHEGRLDFPSELANRPVEMGSDPDEVVEAIHRVIDERHGAS